MTGEGADAILLRLAEVIQGRKDERPERSYVVRLLDGGVDAIGAKITEEAGEVIDAAREPDSEHLTREAADLIFHLWVLLAHRDVDPRAVLGELERRFGVSGIDEKESRSARPREL